ncbi:hypothetical protein, partial [Salinigranum sp.]|uniref:hypothetical protein n=1 Tax=Salinigranum sp. TaxID=1966351 RepID=UPI0035617A45
QPTDLLGHASTVPEEFVVTVVGVLRFQEIELVAEGEKKLSVDVVNLVGVPDTFAEGLDLGSCVIHADIIKFIRGMMKVMYTSRPRLLLIHRS